jgi:hypothetical protein
MTNPLELTTNFILELQKNEENFLRSEQCKEEGLGLYEKLIVWLSDPRSEDYKMAVCNIFSLLTELYKRDVITTTNELSRRAIDRIQDVRKPKEGSTLDQFLKNQEFLLSRH